METMAHWQQVVSLSLPRCSYLFVQYSRDLARWYKQGIHKALFKKMHTTLPYTKVRRAARRDLMSRLHVDVPSTKLLLRLTEQLLAQQIFSVEITLSSHALGAVQVCMVTHLARVWINRVRLPILLAAS